jgi:hypothetical protein
VSQDTRVKELLLIGKRLFSRKKLHDQINQEIAENIYLERADFTRSLQSGEDYGASIYDSQPILARETLGNAINSMLRQGDWYEIKTGDEERDEKVANATALDQATKLFRANNNKPSVGFARATKEADMDWVAFGNPVLSVEENRNRDNIIYRAWHPRDCAWMVNENGDVDTHFRKGKFSARDMKKMVDSGRWKGPLNPTIEQAASKEPMKEFEVMHVLKLTEDIYGDDGKKLRKIRHPYISIYIDMEHQTMLNEFGSPVFNYVVPRWRTLSGDPNGWSPSARNALGDARMLQAMARVILEQGEKAVDPPMIGVGEIFTRDINMYSGGFTEVDLPDDARLADKFTTVNTSDGLRAGLELKQDVREMIAESFLLNKLFLPSVREMRELEVAVRTEEFRRAALPFFQPIESEYHQPLLSVGFTLSVRMGIIPRDIFPPELQNEEVDFTFNSPLNEAEGIKTVEAFNSSMQTIAAGGQVDETVAKMFDVRQATIDAVRGSGAEPDWILSDEQIEEESAKAEQQKALAEGAEIARQGAGVVADLANASVAAENAGIG